MLDDDLTGMQFALEEARVAASEHEVPIGAVVMHNGEVIARDHNRIVQRNDPTSTCRNARYWAGSKKVGRSVAK